MRQTKSIPWSVRHWFTVFSVGWGAFVISPFLAPIFMRIGWQNAASAIYQLFSLLCHQLPQRSIFLFGSKAMYSLSEIQAATGLSNNPLVLRTFIGNVEFGWKIAWSDRMIFMYTSILPFAWIWYAMRRRVKHLPIWGLVAFMLPMFFDGITHVVSDFSGIGEGFRYHNQWLANLTNNFLPHTFYYGDALGSFNSWMRLLTGLLFGIGVVWFAFPEAWGVFEDIERKYASKFRQIAMLDRQLEEHLSEVKRK